MRFPYKMVVGSFYNDTMSVTSGAWITNPSGTPKFTHVFSGVSVAGSV